MEIDLYSLVLVLVITVLSSVLSSSLYSFGTLMIVQREFVHVSIYLLIEMLNTRHLS